MWRFLVRWWRRYDHRYRWWWRAGNLAALLLVVAGIVLPVLSTILTNNSYALSPAAQALVGKSDPTLAKQLSWDAQDQAWQFNAKSVVNSANLPGGAGAAGALAAMRAQVGTPSGKGHDTSTYALTLPQDLSQGITYTDTNKQLSFSLVPEFKTHPGRMVDGHIVYPLPGGKQAIYTLKNNGLKEDIFVPKSHAPTLSLGFHLKLPGTLEARQLPDGSGGIGIYSADPSLYGNVTYGSNSDQQAVERARQTAQKNNLVFALPAPAITAPRGVSLGSASSRFEQSQSELQVVAEDLDSIAAPLSIDPSVVVTSASDFSTGNNEDNIDFSISGQISRGGLTGGSISAGWTASTNLTTTRSQLGTVAYNGYLYVLGGSKGGTALNSVQYAPINANGSLGTWQSTASFTTARYGLEALAYNGYLYVMGGYTGSSYLNSVQYAPINANGSLGTWQSTANFTTARQSFGALAYNGYLYVMGGGGTGWFNDVQYTSVHADGTVGTWQSTTSFTTGRQGLAGVAYGGYLYAWGGVSSAGTYLSDVQYAPINANGTVGTWQSTTSFTTGRQNLGSVIYNGYMYTIGGYSGTYLSDVQYAKIDPPGVTGNYKSTTSFVYDSTTSNSITYNGYLYIIGGSDGNGFLNDVQYAPINANGTIGTWKYTYNSASSSSFVGGFTTARGYLSSVIYNGYLYIMGGTDGSTYYNDVQYAPINANGTVGTWQYTYNSASSSSFTGGFTTARSGLGAITYGGYLYVMGGTNGSTYYNDVQYAPLNADGTVGTWQYTYNSASGSSFVGGFATARGYFGAITYGGYLYVMGGRSSGFRNDVQYAPINANGTIGTWQATASFATARSDFGAVAYNGYLYIIGGDGSSSPYYYNDVQYAPINANGTIGTWQATSQITTARNMLSATAYGGYIYVLGGNDSTTARLNDVQYAPINNGGPGTAGSWSTTNSLVAGTWQAATATYNNYLYMIGGYDGSNKQTVQFTSLTGGGTTSTWATTTALPSGRYGTTGFAYKGSLYVVGGSQYDNTSYSSVLYAHINTDGTIGTWQTTTSLPSARYAPDAVVYNGYLYAIGGYGTSNLTDVLYAPIHTNGTIGSWSSSTNFELSGVGAAAIAYNGCLYLLGGYYSKALTTVQVASFNANGSIGDWSLTTPFPSGRDYPAAAISNGYLYLAGGTFSSGTGQATVQSTPLNSIGRVGHYSKLIDLGAAVNVSGVTYNGTSGGAVSVSYRAAGVDGVFGASSGVSNISGSGCTSNVASTRYLLLTVTLNDSYGQGTAGSFPDSVGTAANLTDLTVNYSTGHPPPNIRLRAGQTMQQGNLSALDTCS